MVGRALDQLIGVFAPGKALKRAALRQALEGRAYAAARPGRGSWSPIDGTVNDEIRTSSPKVRQRVRQLVRDFPFFTRATEMHVALYVGPGLVLQSQAPGGREIRQAIEGVFRRWSEEADIAGKMSFQELCQLAVRQSCESGEYLFVMRESNDPRRFLPFCLQAIEADRLTDMGNVSNPAHELDQGIEYDPDTGRVHAYHVLDSDENPVRIPAAQVIHGFQALRPGQLRGISPFASGVLAANDLGQYLGNELECAQLASRYLGFVQTSDIAGFQEMRGTTVNTATGQREESLDGAVLEYLRPGESITLASSTRPGDNFQAFVKTVLQMLSVTTGIPYEILSGDYSQVNYSTLRSSRNDLAQALKVGQGRIINQLCRPVFREVLRQAVLRGKLALPGFWQEIEAYHRAKWIGPGLESVDPFKESRANAASIESLLKSPQEIAAARGRDFEEILDEIEEARAMASKRGLSMGEVSTALASNPAAIEDENK